MASGQVKEVKRRISSIESTAQITKAMELVASSKLRKAKQRAEDARPYFETLYETMHQIGSISGANRSIYTTLDKDKPKCIIAIAGDSGLAGGYNSNVLKLISSMLDEGDKVICIGKKSIEYFAKTDFTPIYGVQDIGETADISEIRRISEIVSKMFKAKEVGQVIVAFTTFVSPLTQTPTSYTILPLAGDFEKSTAAHEVTMYEPSAEEVFEMIITDYLIGMINGAVMESFASEQGARRTAMSAANDNAKEMLEELQLLYNRARQSVITQEITEIVNGAQALE